VSLAAATRLITTSLRPQFQFGAKVVEQSLVKRLLERDSNIGRA
jgi:hypothetical protein